jgi:MYXO-CTERM domain-containing protein
MSPDECGLPGVVCSSSSGPPVWLVLVLGVALVVWAGRRWWY